MTTVKNFWSDKGMKPNKDFMKRELQIVTLANAEVKRRGFDESCEEFGEMVHDIVHELHQALRPKNKTR
ncbi:hypothetical protein [Niallia sp.]|uniref:hypothetical protein n=1 Tax=Niallia sp. TaxID=2837523 RepID=UPI002898B44F|nr:hypothetical protein [Niallia sp.]